MFPTEERNIITDAAPAPGSHILVLGDSIARDFRFGASGGAMLEQLDRNGGPAAGTMLINAGFGGFKLRDAAGSNSFLNLPAETEAQALADAKAIMTAHPAVDAAVISLGINDLADVVPAPSADPNYTKAEVTAGLDHLIDELRSHNGAGNIPVVLLLPGRDRSTGTKAGAGQTWREGALDIFPKTAVYAIDYYDVDIEDSVHPSIDGYQKLGFRVGRLLAEILYGIPANSGPPMIQAISRTDDLTMNIQFQVPTGQVLTQPSVPSGWRVEDAVTGAPLRISRLDWVSGTEANLILRDASPNHFRLMAPHDLVTGFAPEGVIRTREGGDAHEPGFALQSFADDTA